MSFGHTEEEIKTNNEDISSRKKFKSRIGNIHKEEEKKSNSLNNSQSLEFTKYMETNYYSQHMKDQ
jgi:hypothetical protein